MQRKSSFYPYSVDNIHLGFSVDCVILCFNKKKLQVLLNQFDISEYWQLPGGFMLKEENSDEAAVRILSNRTGLSSVYLKQFHLFSDPKRTIFEQNAEYINREAEKGLDIEDVNKWFLQRFISLGYYAFVRQDEAVLTCTKEDVAKWFDIENLPSLYSDHETIIKTAIENIRAMLPLIPAAQELLPPKFTMGELRKLYEIILGKTMDRRNFQRKILSSETVVQLNEVKNTSPYNPPLLYSFNKEKKYMFDFSF